MNKQIEKTTPQTSPQTSMMDVKARSAQARIESQLTAAIKFPRVEEECLAMILRACQHGKVALQAEYSYNRGDTVIRGASVRLMETIAQHWKHLNTGTIDLTRGVDESGVGFTVVEAFCWDMQTNVIETKVFTVAHLRQTKRGDYPLTDERDIYECIANSAARRKRSCMEAIIPEWVKEAAVEACREAVEKLTVINEDTIAGIAKGFNGIGVTWEQLENLLGHPLNTEQLTRKELINLRNIYATIKDGMQRVTDFFPGDSDEGPVRDDTPPVADEEVSQDAHETGLSSRQANERGDGSPTYLGDQNHGVPGVPQTATLDELLGLVADATTGGELAAVATKAQRLDPADTSELLEAMNIRQKEIAEDSKAKK